MFAHRKTKLGYTFGCSLVDKRWRSWVAHKGFQKDSKARVTEIRIGNHLGDQHSIFADFPTSCRAISRFQMEISFYLYKAKKIPCFFDDSNLSGDIKIIF